MDSGELEEMYNKHLGQVSGGAGTDPHSLDTPPPEELQPSAMTGHEYIPEANILEYVNLSNGEFLVGSADGVFSEFRLKRVRALVLEEVALHLGHQLEEWKKKNGISVQPEKRGEAPLKV